MNTQEAIKRVEQMGEYERFVDEPISKKSVLDIISQIDESQKVVVPQFVADWLEVCKENLGFGLSSAMSHSTSVMKAQPNNVKGWFNLKDNQETFAKAWLYGYEVEKDKLYTVEIPNNNQPDHLVLWKYAKEEVCINRLLSDNWRDYKRVQLTEAEIKKDFDWAWQFAEEVEEC